MVVATAARAWSGFTLSFLVISVLSYFGMGDVQLMDRIGHPQLNRPIIPSPQLNPMQCHIQSNNTCNPALPIHVTQSKAARTKLDSDEKATQAVKRQARNLNTQTHSPADTDRKRWTLHQLRLDHHITPLIVGCCMMQAWNVL